MTILDEVTKLISREHNITLAEANKLRKIAANLDNQDFEAARRDLNEGGGGAFTLAERKAILRILGSEDGGDDGTTITNLQDRSKTDKRINRGTTISSGKKKALRKFFKGVGDNISGEVLHFHDSFTDADSTSMPLHTPDLNPEGSIWLTLQGAPQIVNNRSSSTTNSEHWGTIDMGVSDNFILEATCYNGAGFGHTGIAVCTPDFSNYILLARFNTINNVELRKRVATVNTTVDSLAGDPTGETGVLRLKKVGTTYTGYLDGVEVVSGTISDAVFDGKTRHGFYHFASGGIRGEIDDLRLYTLL